MNRCQTVPRIHVAAVTLDLLCNRNKLSVMGSKDFIQGSLFEAILEYRSTYGISQNSDWSSAALISALIVQLHTSCACDCTVVRVMPE